MSIAKTFRHCNRCILERMIFPFTYQIYKDNSHNIRTTATDLQLITRKIQIRIVKTFEKAITTHIH